MEYVRFGSTGLKVSRICLGCMSYGQPTSVGSGRWMKNKAALSSSARWNWESISLTPPMSTRRG